MEYPIFDTHAHYSAQCIYMRLYKDRIVRVFSAEIRNHSTFYCAVCRHSQFLKFI